MKRPSSSDAVSNLIGYIIITAVLMVLMVTVMITANDALMDKPVERFMYHSYVDIGNGVSARVVDIYTIAPGTGYIVSDFNTPYDVLGEGYTVSVRKSGADQEIIVFGDRTETVISLAGIGATRPVTGTTSGGGHTRVIYDSGGV
ncbi:MAG: hypothetical protein D5R99_02305 [Methanocalculus sp. MSAO_Arc1]|uniref:hypothetical protein n=1 Tax=Methanocalculus TaxID=71151 RepID=UPI000FF45780|nr:MULTISPECIES: hypothetical protein [unclassified Methanocalculus]MCP1661681.1 hypothetical protein [Methanocalculus sp. AMF5]RQD81425.1 MAG: hypothetical protein D5R99_02305 [Methanocalculus sp. MSAO_Arc1]